MEQAITTEATDQVAADTNTFKLKSPLVVDTKEYHELSVEVDRLTGRDMKQLEQEYKTLYRKDAQLTPVTDVRFRELVLGRINGFNGMNLETLPASVYNQLQLVILGKLLESA